MRIALISDIHGNVIALDAVLADANAVGIEQFWFVGDFAAIGPEPAEAIEKVTNLRRAEFTRGNTDRYVVAGDRPPPDLATVQANPLLVSTYAGIASSLSWTRGYVTGAGWFDWLERLPLDIRFTTPHGIRLLAVHASPGCDDGEGVHAGRSNAELARLVDGCNADVIFVGHTHEPMVRRVNDVLVVNLGSVSNPRTADLRASYVVLEVTAAGIELQHRRVAYDHQAFAERVRRSRHPAAEFILGFQRGGERGREPHSDHVPLTLDEKVRVCAVERIGQ